VRAVPRTVVEEVSRTFDLFYSPLPKGVKPEEARLKKTTRRLVSLKERASFGGRVA